MLFITGKMSEKGANTARCILVVSIGISVLIASAGFAMAVVVYVMR